MGKKDSDKSTGTRHSFQSVEVKLANRLRQIRQEKDLTLSQLAQKANMSQAYLSRVENHKVSLAISGLERLAAALDVTIAVFFEEDTLNIPIAHTLKGGGVRKHFRGPSGSVFEMLAASKKGKLMEPLIVEVPRATEAITPKGHSGEEFNYILSGECILTYGDSEIRLREGDSVYYESSVPHFARAVGNKGCFILAVVSSREYLFHGDLTRLLKGHRQ